MLVSPAATLLVAQCSIQPPWCHSGVQLASVLAGEYVAVQTDSLWGAERPRGSSSRGSCSWKPGASLSPAEHGLWCNSHPGALSSCCVCASFFCAPHRCYENLRSPAGKVTSARLVLPPPKSLSGALQWVGRAPVNQTSCSYCQFVSSFLCPPSSSPTCLHPCAGSLVLSFLPVCPLLSSAREIFGEIFQLRRGPWLLAPPLMS